MKLLLFLISIFTLSLNSHSQINKVNKSNKMISIHCITPLKLTAGQSYKFKVQVSHLLKHEQTGHLTLSILNHKTKQSVDGWFLNLFPFQYFTTLLNEKFETAFPITVPYDYSGSINIEIVAKVGELKDSILRTIPVIKTK